MFVILSKCFITYVRSRALSGGLLPVCARSNCTMTSAPSSWRLTNAFSAKTGNGSKRQPVSHSSNNNIYRKNKKKLNRACFRFATNSVESVGIASSFILYNHRRKSDNNRHRQIVVMSASPLDGSGVGMKPELCHAIDEFITRHKIVLFMKV